MSMDATSQVIGDRRFASTVRMRGGGERCRSCAEAEDLLQRRVLRPLFGRKSMASRHVAAEFFSSQPTGRGLRFPDFGPDRSGAMSVSPSDSVSVVVTPDR